MSRNSNIQMTQQGAEYLVPGQTDGLRLLPAVMIDGNGNVIGSIDQNNGFAAILATEIGGPVAEVYKEPPTQRTSSGNTGGLPLNPQVAGVLGMFLGINVTAVSGTSPVMTVSLEQQDANGIWQIVATTGQITAVGALNLSVGSCTQNSAMLNGGPYRVSWIIAGTTPSFTFQLSLQGR